MKKVLILIMVCLSSAATATTYYIDPSGSNSNNGSSGAPWLTLSYACSHTSAGDIIHVNAGTYNENSRCNLPVGVSIVGEGDASLINTSYDAGGIHNGTIALQSSPGNPVNGNQSISYIRINGGNNPGSTAIDIEFRYNVSIHHCTIVDCTLYGIWIFNNNRSYPLPPTVTFATGNNIHDCTFINCEHRFEGQSGFLYYNNTHTNSTRDVKCLTSDWMKGFIIRDNVFTKVFSETGWNFVFETWHYSDNSEIYNNIFHGNAALDISDVRKGNGSWGLKIYNNSFLVDESSPYSENGGEILDLEGWGALQYIYIYNNYFKNCVSAIWVGAYNQENCVYPDGVHWALDHIYIYYNIVDNAGCTNNAVPSTVWFWDNHTEGYTFNQRWDNIYVCNNVLTSAPGPNQNQNGIQLSLSAPATNFHIDNNIIKGYAWLPINFSNGINFNTVSIQKNLFYQNGSNTVRYSNAPSNNTESNLTPANPLFVSSTDFHLQAGSPAIGNGIAIPEFTSDFANNAVKNPPSIGAYEYGSGPASADIPVYQSSVVEAATPSIIEMKYNLTLANSVPAPSAFNVKVNGINRAVNSVTISGDRVRLTLSIAVIYGDILKIAYTQPASDPIKTPTEGVAASISNQLVTNNCVNKAPAVAITSPGANSSFTAPANITITATASDADGSITLVEFFNGNTKLGSKTAAPYSFNWTNVPAGTYLLTVAATDNLNSKTISSVISISVVNSSPGANQPPVISISNPVKGNKFENINSITIDAIASDPDGSIIKVEFFCGSDKLVELTSPPYTYVWKNVKEGICSITAVATDNLNATTTSLPVDFEVRSVIKYDPDAEIIKLYPNPNDGHFSIKFTTPLQNETSSIIITDLAGKQVFNGFINKEVTSKQFDLSENGSGIYMMMIKDKEILVTKKFIKN